jgi:hypothetical protein
VAAGLLALNINHPRVIEALASIAVVWANLAYLFVTAPRLMRRFRGVGVPGAEQDEDERIDGRFGPWWLAVNLAAVGWGVALVVNIGWPRPEVYGDGRLGRYGAAPATAAMLAAGFAAYRFVRRRHAPGVLDEHRA